MIFESNQALVDFMIARGVLKTPALINGFIKVDRAHFINKKWQGLAYADQPLPIGEGQTISQPSTVAFMLELLSPESGQNILEIGAGSGYVTALLAAIVGLQGSVVAMERIKILAKQGRENIKDLLGKRVQYIIGDGTQGYKKNSPYDRIIVSAAASRIPEALISQLKDGGVMVVPVGKETQTMLRIIKKGSSFDITEYPGFVFVPLISE